MNSQYGSRRWLQLSAYLILLLQTVHGLTDSQYDEALKVINKTDFYMPDDFVYIQWQPLILYDIDEVALQMKVYGFLTWVAEYSSFPQFTNTKLPDFLELALFPPFLKSPYLWVSSRRESLKNEYPAITYLSKVSWVTVTNAYTLPMKCKRISGTYYPYEEYKCESEIVSHHAKLHCLNMQDKKAVYSCLNPTYHDCTVNTTKMKYFNKTFNNESLVRKWEPISISMETRKRYNRQIIVLSTHMKRIPQKYVAMDAMCGFVAGLAAIFQCLIPCSCKERLIVGMLAFLIYTSSLPTLDELTPILRGETCSLVHFYLIIGVIQVLSFLWSVISTHLWYRAGKKIRESNEFQLMPSFTSRITACLAKITFASYLIESPEIVLIKMTRFHNQQLAKLYEKKTEEETTTSDTESGAAKVEFSEGESSSDGTGANIHNELNANLRHWHIFCLLIDRLLFAILIVMFVVGAVVFLG